MANTVNINGTVLVGDRSVVVRGNRVLIDGKDVTGVTSERVINIQIEGDVPELSVDACNRVTITGNVQKVTTMSGDVQCGDVGGSVQTMSGDVTCGKIGGNVSTLSGDITSR